MLFRSFDSSTVQTLRLTRGDFSLELTRGGASAASEPAAVPAASAAALAVSAEGAGTVITAPLVGTFYAAPAPEQPPFVLAGSQVRKGETVCLIEAMKNMIEVPAPCDCVIEAVLKASGELAAFGEALLRIRPC